MLANAAQILMAREHRVSQGHHRDSALLYSRNDTCSKMAFGQKAAWREARKRRFPKPPFPVATYHPPKQIPYCDLQAGEWVIFTSRREAMRSKVQIEDSSSVPTDSAASAQQPDAVKRWAEHRRNSDSDTVRASQNRGSPDDVRLQWAVVRTAQGSSRIDGRLLPGQESLRADTEVPMRVCHRRRCSGSLDCKARQRLPPQRLRIKA